LSKRVDSHPFHKKEFVNMARAFRIILFLGLMVMPALLYAEGADKRPTNVKVLDEYKDGKGNLVRIVQFNEGLMRVTQTIIQPARPSVGLVVPIRLDTAKRDSISIFISKSNYMLLVKYRGRIIRTYKAVFGPNPLQNKLVEGDRNTPEGEFKIAAKNGTSKYDKFLALNYPNDEALTRFNKLKAAGQLPASARIGGDVGIHGIWPGGDDMIQLGIGWTDGCIALKNKDVEDLFSLVNVGTKVVIRK
jgi:lipoprotein-anchoring transpeptidase ErfK/SrfK